MFRLIIILNDAQGVDPEIRNAELINEIDRVSNRPGNLISAMLERIFFQEVVQSLLLCLQRTCTAPNVA